MRISYLKTLANPFICEMCSKSGKFQFEARPSLPALANWVSMNICKRCASREVGSKGQKKKIQAIMEAANEEKRE